MAALRACSKASRQLFASGNSLTSRSLRWAPGDSPPFVNRSMSPLGLKNHPSASFSSEGGKSSWMPSWMKNIPGLGSKEEDGQFAEMSLDTFATNLGRARMAGSLTGIVGGKKAGGQDQIAQLRQYENIINAMTPEERKSPSLIGAAASERISAAAGCRPDQVQDCLLKFRTMNKLLSEMSARKKAGLPLPKSVEDVNGMLGSNGWSGAAGAGNAGGPNIASDGQPCPLIGRGGVGRNDICPKTRKKVKKCCGAGLS